MKDTQTRFETKAIATVSKRPELKRTAPGVPVCRFTVVADDATARNPVKMSIYAYGGPGESQRELAFRCAKLRVGEPVEVSGLLRQRVRTTKGGKRWTETAMQAYDVYALDADGSRVEPDAALMQRQMKGLVVHCLATPYEEYIGRGRCPWTGTWSEWGNKYSHRESAFERVIRVDTPQEAVALYKANLWKEIQAGGVPVLERLASLAGKTLGCWCAPSCCHGDVLASASVWAVEKLARERSAC